MRVARENTLPCLGFRLKAESMLLLQGFKDLNGLFLFSWRIFAGRDPYTCTDDHAQLDMITGTKKGRIKGKEESGLLYSGSPWSLEAFGSLAVWSAHAHCLHCYHL